MPDLSLRVPTWCPLCKGIMKGKSTNTYYQHGVCVICFIEFVEGREERWKTGWRPTAEELERVEQKLRESTD